MIEKFMGDFDAVLRKGFDVLIGKSLDEKWWRLAQLPAKFGGMAMRSGLRTFGAQHIVSLIKTSAEVSRIVGSYNACDVAKRETKEWLTNACRGEITVEQVVDKIGKENENVGVGLQRQRIYSIAKFCELHEHRRVCEMMSPEERIHIEAHSGPHHTWVTLLPLSFKGYNMTSAV